MYRVCGVGIPPSSRTRTLGHCRPVRFLRFRCERLVTNQIHKRNFSSIAIRREPRSAIAPSAMAERDERRERAEFAQLMNRQVGPRPSSLRGAVRWAESYVAWTSACAWKQYNDMCAQLQINAFVTTMTSQCWKKCIDRTEVVWRCSCSPCTPHGALLLCLTRSLSIRSSVSVSL